MNDSKVRRFCLVPTCQSANEPVVSKEDAEDENGGRDAQR